MFSIRKPITVIALIGCGPMLTPLAADVVGIGLFGETDVNGPPSSEVMYTSTILGGGLFGNNVGLNYSPGDNTAHLITSPGTMPPGLTSGTLDLSADGAEVYASGSLATGATHIFAHSPTGAVSQIGPYVALEDGLIFHVRGGGPAEIFVGLAVDGTENGGTIGWYSQSLELGLGGAGFVWFAAQNANGYSAYSINSNSGWVGGAGAVSNLGLTGVDFLGGLQVTNGEDLQFALAQGLTCANGADCDFQNTAQISLILPAGVTYSSGSGVFLTANAASAPEPASLILLGTTLLGAGWWRYRKVLPSRNDLPHIAPKFRSRYTLHQRNASRPATMKG